MTDTFRKEYKPLTDEQKDAVAQIKTCAEELHALIDGYEYDPRSKALAKTNLEQAVMWAVKGITA